MKRGRPKHKGIDPLDITNIKVDMSFNQIRYLANKFRKCRTDSVEGNLCIQMVEGVRYYLKRKIKKGANIPKELVEVLSEDE